MAGMFIDIPFYDKNASNVTINYNHLLGSNGIGFILPLSTCADKHGATIHNNFAS